MRMLKEELSAMNENNKLIALIEKIESKDNYINKLKNELKEVNSNYIKINSDYQNIKIKLYNIQKQLYINNLNDFNNSASKYNDNNIIIDQYDINNFISYFENYVTKSSEFFNSNSKDVVKLNVIIDTLEQDNNNNKIDLKELKNEKELLITYYTNLLKEKQIDMEKVQSQLK